jgi:hypothetical protein
MGSSSGSSSKSSSSPAGYSSKNDAAGPRKDSSGKNASSASRPSSSGYNSSRVGGNNSSNGLGLRTGATQYGNTSYGPAGGDAKGYATSTTNKTTGKTSYSNYRNLDGSKANVSWAGYGGAGNTVSSPTKSSASYRITPTGNNYKKTAEALKKAAGKVPTKVPNKPGLGFRYNYAYPKGFGYGNYFTNPTDDPVRRVRGPNPVTAPRTGTNTSTMPKNRGSSAKDQSRVPKMGMAKGGVVPGAKKSIAKGKPKAMTAKKPKR